MDVAGDLGHRVHYTGMVWGEDQTLWASLCLGRLWMKGGNPEGFQARELHGLSCSSKQLFCFPGEEQRGPLESRLSLSHKMELVCPSYKVFPTLLNNHSCIWKV